MEDESFGACGAIVLMIAAAFIGAFAIAGLLNLIAAVQQ